MVSRGSSSNRLPGQSGGQNAPVLMNNFVGGLKTEFTGLNFPENACTAASNCVFTLIGDIVRRPGIDFELNSTVVPYSQLGVSNLTGLAINTYRWTNVGGDGQTQILALQAGGMIYFFQSTNSTIASPLSTTILVSTVNLASFRAVGSTANVALTECQFTDGNGYLFVFHPNCDPIYCSFTAGVVTPNVIIIQIRDFAGLPDGLPVSLRPFTLTPEHNYNLYNQGWNAIPGWAGGCSINQAVFVGQTNTFTIQTGLSATANQTFAFNLNGGNRGNGLGSGTGIVNSYNTVSGLLNWSVTSTSSYPADTTWLGFTATSQNSGTITTWFTAEQNYPSNSDVWWTYKNSSGVFSPSTTAANVSTAVGQAAQGAFILNAFTQNRGAVSGLGGLTVISTLTRPRTGAWYAGRVFYSGVDASFSAQGDAPFTTWTENIYFSQIVSSPADFPLCYQTNDPTSQTLFGLLPSDGGVIVIQGSGAIYKLEPVQNGLLVFAANGIWFITGGQGIGFTANDYTITKVSNIQSISGTSFINVLGTIIFWNEEGIYTVATSQGVEAQAPLGFTHGGLLINNICVGSILSFYQSIPLQSKKFVRADYNPITYTVKWLYRSTNETDISNRYNFDSVLNYNTLRQAFSPYSISSPTVNVAGINYIAGPGGSTSPSPMFKYLTTTPGGITFSEERDVTNWVDFISFDSIGAQYTSTFTTGYANQGQFLTKIQPTYLYMYSRGTNTQYQVQSIFDFATDPQSGKYSQAVTTMDQNHSFFGMVKKRLRVRGNGYTFQILVTSVPGQPFDIMGWSIYEYRNTSI